MRFHFLVILALLAMLVWARPVHAARALDNCTGTINSLPAVISTPGTWCMKQNLSTAMTSGAAITVSSDNVVIDCNDFHLAGPGIGLDYQAYGVLVLNQSNVHVRHCAIEGFWTGVYLGGSRHVVEDNHFDGIAAEGVFVVGDDVRIRRNLITRTGGLMSSTTGYYPEPIVLSGSGDILDNTIEGVIPVAGSGPAGTVFGISVDQDAHGTVIAHNQLSGFTLGPQGQVYAIETVFAYRAALRGNVARFSTVIGEYDVGVSCNDTTSRVKNSVVTSFNVPLLSCGDAGRNDLAP